MTVAACFYVPQALAPVSADAGSGPRVPVFDAVDVAARALGRVADYAEWLALPEGRPLELDESQVEAVQAVVAPAVEREQRTLGSADAAQALRAIGLSTVASVTVTTADEALAAARDIGYPVVLKAACRDPLAKTVSGGLALDLAEPGALTSAWHRMEGHFGDDMLPAFVQTMVDPGIDVAVEVTDREQVGPVLSLRSGGATGALDPAEDMRVLPLGDLEVRRFIEGSRMAPHLPPALRTVLEDVLLRTGALVEAVPEIVGLRMNPVIVRADEAVITDVVIDVAAVERDPLPPIRRV